MAPASKSSKNKAGSSGIEKIKKRMKGKCFKCNITEANRFHHCVDGTGNKICATCYVKAKRHADKIAVAKEPTEDNPVSPEDTIEKIKRKCSNCDAEEARKFYRVPDGSGNEVCSSCYCYSLLHGGVARNPETIAKNIALGRKRRKETLARIKAEKEARGEVIKHRCDNCGTDRNRGWRLNVGDLERVCSNCNNYFKRNGRHRPPELEEQRMENVELRAAGKTLKKRLFHKDPKPDGDSGAGKKGRKPRKGAVTVDSDSDDGGRSESSEGTDSGSDDENSEPQRPGPSNAKRPPPRRRRMTLNSESDEDEAAVRTPVKKQSKPTTMNEDESDGPEYDYDCPGPSQRPGPSNVGRTDPQPPRRRRGTSNLKSDENPKKKKAEVVTRKMRNPIESESDGLEDDGSCPGPSQRPGPSNARRAVESDSGEESDEALNELMSTLSTLTDEQKRIVVEKLTKKTPVKENQRAAEPDSIRTVSKKTQFVDPDEFVEEDGEDSDSCPTKLTAEQRRNIMRKLTETDSENESDEEGSDSRRKVSKDRTAPMDLDEEVVPRKMVKRSEESEGSRQTKKLAMKRTRGADSDGSEDREEATGTVNREMKLTRTRARRPPAKRRAAEANEPKNKEPSDDRRLKKTNNAALTEPDNLFVTYFGGDLQHVEVLKRVQIEGQGEAEDREDVEDCNHLVGMGPIFEQDPLDAYEGAMIGKEDPEVEPGNADDQEDDEEEIQEAAEAGNQAEESDDEEVAEDPEVMPDAADNQEQAIIKEDLGMNQSHEGNFDENQEPRSMPLEDRREEVNTDEAEDQAEEVDDEEDDDVIWVEDVLRATTPVKDEEVPQDGEGPVEAREDQEDDEDQAVEEEVITDEAQDQAEEVDDEEDDDVIWLEDVLCAQIEVPQDGEGEDQKDADGIEEDPEAVEDQEHAEPVTEPIAEDQIPDVKDEDQEHDERIPASGDVADEAGKNQEAMNPEGLQNVSEAEPSDDPVAREDQDPIPEIVAEEAAEDHEDDEDQVAEEVPRDPEDQTVEPKAEVEEEQDEVPPGDRRVRRSNEVVNDQEMKEEAADDQERDEEEAGEDQEDQNEADPEKELQNEPEAEPEPADDQMEVMEGEDLERDETMLIGGADKEEENPVEAMPVFVKKYAFYMGLRYSIKEFFGFINQMCLRFPAHLSFPNKEEEQLERVFIFYKDWDQNMKKMVAKSTWLSEEEISKWLIERKEYEEPDGNVKDEDVFWVKMRKLYNFLDGELPVEIHKQIAFWVKVTVATLRKTLNLPEPEGGSEVESEDEMDEVDGQNQERDQEGMQAEPEAEPEAADNQMQAVEGEDQERDDLILVGGPVAEEAGEDHEEEDQEEANPEAEPEVADDHMEVVEDEDQEREKEDAGEDHGEADPDEPRNEPAAEPEVEAETERATDPVAPRDQIPTVEDEDQEHAERIPARGPVAEETAQNHKEKDPEEADLEEELQNEPEAAAEPANDQMEVVEDEDQGRDEPIPAGGTVARGAGEDRIEEDQEAMDSNGVADHQMDVMEDEDQEHDERFLAREAVVDETDEDQEAVNPEKLQNVPEAEPEGEAEAELVTDPVSREDEMEAVEDKDQEHAEGVPKLIASGDQIPAMKDDDQDLIPAGEPVTEEFSQDPLVGAEIRNEDVDLSAPLSQPTLTSIEVKTTPVDSLINIPIVPQEETFELPIWSSPAFNPQINQFFFYPDVVGSMTDFFNLLMRIRINLPDNLILVNQKEKLLEREFVWIQDFDKFPNFKKKLAEATGLIEQGLTTWFNERVEFEVTAEPIDIEKMDFVTKMEKLLHFFNGFVPESIYANIANWAETNFLHVKYYLEARKSMKLKALAF